MACITTDCDGTVCESLIISSFRQRWHSQQIPVLGRFQCTLIYQTFFTTTKYLRRSYWPRPSVPPSCQGFDSRYCWGRSAPKPPDTVKGLLPLYDSPLRPQGPRVQFCFVYTPLARQRLAALRVHKTKLCLRLSGNSLFC